MNVTLILLPLISAFTGWLITLIAIKMLFRPYRPKKVLGLTFQGFFPKRQRQIAVRIGKLVSSGVFSYSAIEQKIADPQNVAKILPVLETHIDTFLREKLPVQIPMIGMLIGEKTITQVKGVFLKELEELFPVLMKQYIDTLTTDFDLEKIIPEKIQQLSPLLLEDTLKKVMLSQFRFVKTLGAVLGFITGLIQVFLTIALS